MGCRKLFSFIILIFFMLDFILPQHQAEAATQLTAYQTFSNNLSKDLNSYIKKSGGTVSLQYLDLTSDEKFQINGNRLMSAASTIKLPLAMYVMELAAIKKINLNEKLTYKKYHYYGGSGVIQYHKVGSKYTIRDLVKKAMVHSDNIAFIMLRERVGSQNFINYMKKIGGKYAYPNGRNMTSSSDLVIYANHLYQFSQQNQLGMDLITYLQNTDYNTTIPKGIKGAKTAHKVGMIPMSRIYNDIGIIYDKNPFALAVMTNNIEYTKSQKVIAEIASIVYKHHKEKNKASYIQAKESTAVYQKPTGKLVKIASLTKGETFKISAHKGNMYEIIFGEKKAYIKKSGVTPYSKSNISFIKTTLKKNGIAKASKNVAIKQTASAKGKTIALLMKGQTVYVDSLEGIYYKIQVGQRIGYVHKNDAVLQFSKEIKYFETKKSGTTLYKKVKGKYIKMGTLQKGEVFPKLKGNSTMHQVLFGSSKAYVNKQSTAPILSAKLTEATNKDLPIGTIKLSHEAHIYSKKSNNEAFRLATIHKGETLSYFSKSGEWYKVNISGRVGYVNGKELESE